MVSGHIYEKFNSDHKGENSVTSTIRGNRDLGSDAHLSKTLTLKHVLGEIPLSFYRNVFLITRSA